MLFFAGHRDEQKWRLNKNKKHQQQRIDPDEDLHLQDLEYKNKGEEKQQQQQQQHRDEIDEEGEKNLYKKKHNKVKILSNPKYFCYS